MKILITLNSGFYRSVWQNTGTLSILYIDCLIEEDILGGNIFLEMPRNSIFIMYLEELVWDAPYSYLLSGGW